MTKFIAALLLGIGIGLWIGRHTYAVKLREELRFILALEKRAAALASGQEPERARESGASEHP